MVFHSPQAGQRPSHLGLSFPHEVQNHTVFSLFDAAIFIYKHTKKNGTMPDGVAVLEKKPFF